MEKEFIDFTTWKAQLEKNLSIELPNLLSLKTISNWFECLEEYLGLNKAAEKCDNWDYKSDYYVYAYFDIADQCNRIIYVGIGKNSRAYSHWNGSHNSILNDYIKFWKDNHLEQKDVLKFISIGINQRQAAALETFIFDNLTPEANVVRYWMPDMSHEVTDKHRQKISNFHTEKIISPETRNKLSIANSNNLKLGLWFENNKIKSFTSTSQVRISYWIQKHYNKNVSPSSIWSTIRNDTTHKGFKLKVEKGKIIPNPLSKLLKRRITGSPVISKDEKGNLRVFISIKSAAEILNISDTNIKNVLLGQTSGVLGYNFRELTKNEIANNIIEWPIYYKISVDGNEELSLNLTASAHRHKLNKSIFTLILYHDREFSLSKGKRLTCKLIQNHTRQEIFNFEIIDNLLLPNPSQARQGHWNHKKNHLLELRKVKPKSITDWGRKSSGSLDAAKRNGWHREIFANYCKEVGNLKNPQDPWTYEKVLETLKNLSPQPKRIFEWQKLHPNSYRWASKNNQQHNLMKDLDMGNSS
jgi:hypothetical protein